MRSLKKRGPHVLDDLNDLLFSLQVLKKFGQSLDAPTLHFLPNF